MDRPEFDPKASYPTVKPVTIWRSERDVEAAIVKYLKSLVGCAQLKHGEDGWMDRVVCYKGFFIGIEVKKEDPSACATARQQQRINQVRNAGGLAIVAHSVREVQEVIEYVNQVVNGKITRASSTRSKARQSPPNTRERKPQLDRERKGPEHVKAAAKKTAKTASKTASKTSRPKTASKTSGLRQLRMPGMDRK